MVTKPPVQINWATGTPPEPPVFPGLQVNGFPVGQPSRAIMNGVLNAIGTWTQWLEQVGFNPDDLFGDQALPSATPNVPSLGVGLGPVAAGDFSAAVYASGRRVPDTDGPAHTYAANTDTYWFLDRDAAWSFGQVAAMDPPPATPADSVLVYAVRTNATDRTELFIDYVTSAAIRFQYSVQPMLEAFLLSQDDVNGGGRLAAAGNVRFDEVFTESGKTVGREIRHSNDGAHAGPGGNSAGHTWSFLLNARLMGANIERDQPGRASYLFVFGEEGLEILERDSSLADTWVNEVDAATGWDRLLLSNTTHDFSGDTTVSGNLTAGQVDTLVVNVATFAAGSITVTTGVTIGAAYEYLFDAAKTRIVSIGARNGTGPFTGNAGTGFADRGTGLLTSGIRTTASAATWSIPLVPGLPDGVIVTAVRVHGEAGVADNTTIWVTRTEKLTGSVAYFRAGGTKFDSFNSIPWLGAMDLTVDEAVGIRTIDHDTYDYVLFFSNAGTQDVSAILDVEITYTTVRVI